MMKSSVARLEFYYQMLQNLSDNDKLELIVRLTKSIQTKKKTKKTQDSYFGALNDAESAEEWIARINEGSQLTRQIEPL